MSVLFSLKFYANISQPCSQSFYLTLVYLDYQHDILATILVCYVLLHGSNIFRFIGTAYFKSVNAFNKLKSDIFFVCEYEVLQQ